jgi:hypothetical protein
MARSGLSTLSTLRIFRKPIPDPPKIEIRDTDTTTISKQLKACNKKREFENFNKDG